MLTFCVVQRSEQHRPSSAQAKAAKMIEHRLPGWETAWQVAPGTPRTEDIEDGVEDAAEGMTSRSAVATGRTQVLQQALPLSIGEVAWIGAVHADDCSLSCYHIAEKTRT